MLLLPEAATRKHTVSMPKAYEKTNIRAEGSNIKPNPVIVTMNDIVTK
jgi:hypothetical protein